MEKASTSEQLKRIRSELIHGRDLARQLKTHIKNDSSSSQESIRLFVEGLVNSCSMSISMLTSDELPKHLPLPRMPPESRRTRSAGDNCVWEDADCRVDAQSCNNRSGKRKCVKQVTLEEGAGLETALEDGYSWRKYGQKDILGSRYPRGYYRCACKTTEGCLARKQIQRIDEQGPPVFKITLFGVHSCSHHQQLLSNSQIPSSPAPPPSIPKHDIHFPDQHPLQESVILQHLTPILPSDTTYLEPVYSPTVPEMISHFNHMNTLFPKHMSLDVGYQPSSASYTTWFADHFNEGFYRSGGLETDGPSAVTSTAGSPTGRLRKPIEFDPFSEIVGWDFSG